MGFMRWEWKAVWKDGQVIKHEEKQIKCTTRYGTDGRDFTAITAPPKVVSRGFLKKKGKRI